jgi:hypothetical protein
MRNKSLKIKKAKTVCKNDTLGALIKHCASIKVSAWMIPKLRDFEIHDYAMRQTVLGHFKTYNI